MGSPATENNRPIFDTLRRLRRWLQYSVVGCASPPPRDHQYAEIVTTPLERRIVTVINDPPPVPAARTAPGDIKKDEA